MSAGRPGLPWREPAARPPHETNTHRRRGGGGGKGRGISWRSSAAEQPAHNRQRAGSTPAATLSGMDQWLVDSLISCPRWVRFPLPRFSGTVAQLAEHFLDKEGVGGSSPSGPIRIQDSVAQWPEHPAFNRRAAGSSPAGVMHLPPANMTAGWPSGEGGGLQIHRHHAPTGSNPIPASSFSRIAQLAEHLPRKQEVPGSKPGSGFPIRARSSAAERRHATPEAAGSSPAEHCPTLALVAESEDAAASEAAPSGGAGSNPAGSTSPFPCL